VVANVDREPTKLKTDRHERHGLGLAICHDEIGMMEVV
jgi:hypothetical protein